MQGLRIQMHQDGSWCCRAIVRAHLAPFLALGACPGKLAPCVERQQQVQALLTLAQENTSMRLLKRLKRACLGLWHPPAAPPGMLRAPCSDAGLH